MEGPNQFTRSAFDPSKKPQNLTKQDQETPLLTVVTQATFTFKSIWLIIHMPHQPCQSLGTILYKLSSLSHETAGAA